MDCSKRGVDVVDFPLPSDQVLQDIRRINNALDMIPDKHLATYARPPQMSYLSSGAVPPRRSPRLSWHHHRYLNPRGVPGPRPPEQVVGLFC